ncbi:hypothetical protein [Xanthomonas sp. GPE 39]|uniref:hypothetical protein n=1 Tax=Xanthomonas sp. GPE 39 TaxID=1583099 RepID=UPI0005F2E78E|nr:hypothetical protein [Xanthomonas sp. GPE 39]
MIKWQNLFVASVLALAVSGLVCAQEASTPAAATQTVYYAEMPSSASALSNAIMVPVIGSSNAVKQMERLMAQGATTPLEVVAYGDNERIVLKSVEAALRFFHGNQLPNLTMGVVASADKVEKLRPLAEQLGVKLVVEQPLKISDAAGSRAK